MSQSYDFIIVGGGSAGCVLANRLSADRSNRVLLLEAGGENRHFLISMPKGFSQTGSMPQFSWHYPVSVDRTEYWVRGRGLGGSSAINGLLYVRGHPQDYEGWAREAGSEWGWAAMKQAFRKIEDHALGDDGVRGVGGPVHVSPNDFRYPLAERAIEAGVQMGLPRREDLSSEEQEGVGYYCYNIKHGKRQSAAVAFLDTARERRNLQVITGAMVRRILFDGRRASGVKFQVGGSTTELKCHGEIIVAAGTIASPKLLQLSGIGPGALLRRNGIAVLHDSPDVGQKTLEHLGLMMSYRLKGDPGINYRLRGVGLARSMIRYVVTKTGPLATGAVEVGAFVRTNPAEPRPNMQLQMSGCSLAGRGAGETADGFRSVEHEPGMTFVPLTLHQTSEGSIEIGSSDPDGPLVIKPNWLSTEHDQRAMIEMVRYVRKFVARPALASVIERELSPGAGITSDEAILDVARRLSLCGTHAVRSCRMGRDKQSVVDERMRVRGLQGLRVVDCSIMPGLISGNTNAPVMAMAWRASDLILEDSMQRTTRLPSYLPHS